MAAFHQTARLLLGFSWDVIKRHIQVRSKHYWNFVQSTTSKLWHFGGQTRNYSWPNTLTLLRRAIKQQV